MTVKEDPNDYKKAGDEPEVMVTAVPTQAHEKPIPEGHSRFYCNKCHTVRSAWCCAVLPVLPDRFVLFLVCSSHHYSF